MAAFELGPGWTTCGTCGLPFKARSSICPGCGTIAPLERLIARGSAVAQKLGRTKNMRFAAVVWGLALCPLLVAPPILALAILRYERENRPTFDTTWVTIFATLNVVFSVLILVRFGSDLRGLLAGLQDQIDPWVHRPVRTGLTPI